MSIPLGSKFALSERSHENGAQPERPQTEAPLHAPTHVIHQRDRTFIHIFLVVKLILDHVIIHKVPHVRADVPADVIRIHVNLSQILDHLILIGYVRL